MSYTVLARKYRPQTFADLVGQEHVARTLANAIEADRVAHAFLFTGVRGVGKTTTARLLAKALNCELGPTPTPCNQCAPCREITSGVDLDVLEMDGASNNSVDDVRRLQESIPYRPARDRFKIVIVDEVHMLSTGAFNAFLKTLEEPPPHVKFIFATTESHKVPVTIRSRCQRYDFRLIPQAVIAKRVREILEAEGVGADDAAVGMVAREAAGSMRDALTLLDQLVAFGGDELRGAEVAAQLGVAGREMLHESARAALLGDGASVLRAVDSLATQGLDMLHFSRQLLDYVRDLVVLRVTGGDAGELVGLVDEERTHARELASSVDLLELQRAFASLSTLVDDVGKSSAPRTVLEMGLVRIATRPPLKDVGELLARLDDLEKRLGGGGGGGGGRAARGGGTSRGGPERSAAARTAPERSAAARTAPGHSAAAPSAPAHRAAPAPAPRPEPAPSRTTAPAPSRASAPAIDPSGPAAAAMEIARMAAAGAPAAPAAPSRPASAPREVAPPRPPSPEAQPRRADAGPQSPDAAALAAWERVVIKVRETRPALGAVLEHGVPLVVSRESVVLGFPEGSFFGQQAEPDEARDTIGECARDVLGGKPAVTVRFTAEAEQRAQPTMAELAEQRRVSARREREEEALRHPLVVDALRIFPEGASSVKVVVDGD